MRPYLRDYINTLSSNREERVSSLIEEARVGKEQLDAIADRLETSFSTLNAVTLRRETPDTRILPNNLIANLRDVTLKIRDMYEISNLVSLLLNSHAAVLASDVKAVEDELIAMEKMANNFAFLLGDSQAYDYAHLEPFSDTRGRSDEQFFSDRTGNHFSEGEQAAVRTDEGVLTLPNGLQNGHGLTAQILRGNANAFTTSDTGLKNALVHGNATGWRAEIASASPATSTIVEGLRGGVQMELEFTLTNPAPSSEVKLVPYADIPIDLYEVRIYKDEDDRKGENVLSEVRTLDRSVTIHFPIQTVQRFTIIINQSTFNKSSVIEKPKETRYLDNVRKLNQKQVQSRFSDHRPFNIRKLERAIQSKTLSVHGDDFYSTSLPLTDARPTRGPMNPALVALNRLRQESNTWYKSQMQFESIMREVMAQRDGDYTKILQGRAEFNNEALSKSEITQDYVPHVLPVEYNPPETKFNYRYTLGLNYVAIGVENPKYKGVFVSKPLPAPSDIGEVRLKAGVDDYTVPVSDRFSRKLTSVEFSVSNKANPTDEEDWVPILPIDVERVEAERMFPSHNGVAYFRFPAQSGQLFSLYRNGYLTSSYDEVPGAPGEVLGLKIDPDVLGPDHVFTCDYYPSRDRTTVNFEPYGFGDTPLVSAYDSTGAGERFLSTGERNTVTLTYEPYVDADRAANSSTYSPLTIQLDNGAVALNMTDYRTGDVLSPPSESGYYYHHSGNTVIFNEPINEPFRVFYDYLQNNVRFRAVLRCNVKDFVSPKVDFVHMKAKTRKSDRRRA